MLYIFISTHQINIHHNTQDLTYVTKLHFCRHYGKGKGVTLVPIPKKSLAIDEGRPSTSSDPKGTPAKCCKILPTPILAKSSIVSNLPSIFVPKLAVPTHTLPEWINHPGCCKHYKCQICVFQHTEIAC